MLKLTEEQYNILNGPMWLTWSAIAPDAEPMCEGDNEIAMEVCIDAGRLLEYGGTGAQAADAVIKALRHEHSYIDVLAALSARFPFV